MHMTSTQALLTAVGILIVLVGVLLSGESRESDMGALVNIAGEVRKPPLQLPSQAHPVQSASPAGEAVPALEHEGRSGSEHIRFAHFKVGNRNVKSMLADGDVVWVGTSGGVIRYEPKKDSYRLFDVRSGLLSNGIFHLSKLNGKLVVGTYGGGLSLFNETDESWSNYNIQHGLADAFIYDVLVLDNGDIWIATWSGANRIRGGDLDDASKWDTFTVKNTGGGLPNDWVYGMELGRDGEIWFATEGGLARFKDGAWRNWKHQDGLGASYEKVKSQIRFTRDPAKESSHHAQQKAEMGLGDVDVAYNPNYIISLYVDQAGVVWCGTWGGGLSSFDGERWKNFTMDDGLPANHVFMLGRERTGRMWVGTSDGLARYENGEFTVFTTRDGLFTNNSFSMANASDGSLWLGGFGGVSRIQGLERVR